MSRFQTLGLVAAVAIVAVVGVVALATSRGGSSVGGPPVTSSPTPAASASPIATASPSPSPSPALTETFTSAVHGFSISLPTGWQQTPAADVSRPDLLVGPQGTLSIISAKIPPGTSQDSWLDIQYRAVLEQLGGCPGGDSGTFDSVRVGTEYGALYKLSCVPGWLVVSAYGDFGLELRFSPAAGAPALTPPDRDFLLALLLTVKWAVATSP